MAEELRILERPQLTRPVLVGAFRVTGENVVGLLASGEHHDRDPRGAVIGPEPARQLETVHVGHVHVGDHQVRRLRADELERLPAVVRDLDVVAVTRKPGREQLSDLFFVVDEENAFA